MILVFRFLLLFCRLSMESTDAAAGMNFLALDVDQMTDLRKSQTSLLSVGGDDGNFQPNEVSNCLFNQ
jgi:hypothetical protein